MQERLSKLLTLYEDGKITRRELLGALVLFVSASRLRADSASFYSTELNHVTIRVRDLKESKQFYQELLGLTLIKEESEVCRLSTGQGFLSLWLAGNSSPGFDHFCIGVKDFERKSAATALANQGIQLRRDADDPETIYVLDPDKISVQIEASGFKG
jgi:catechol 2,3-dioxygenase-like lactoylglutathione lyase family enzyme